MKKSVCALTMAVAITTAVAAGQMVLNSHEEENSMSNNPPRQGQVRTGASRSLKDARAREADIIGRPPRIPPLTRDELNSLGTEAADSVASLRKSLSLSPTAEVPEFNATMLRHPDLYRSHMVLALFLFNGALTVRDRELVILRTGWLCQAPFEWGSHVDIGKRLGRLTDEEIARVIEGSGAEGWSEHDRALLRAVEELHADAMITDETWAVLARSLNEQQLIELPVLVGQYMGVAFVQNSLRVRLMPGGEGLMAR